MNKRAKKYVVLVLTIALLMTMVACRKKEVDQEPVNTETIVNTEMNTEATISPELQQALEEGWIEEDWPEETEPKETEPKETEPEETKPEETTPPATTLGYEQYMNMSAAEQQAFFQTFDSVDAYFAWLNSAKADYEEKQNATDLENGAVDIEDLLGKG